MITEDYVNYEISKLLKEKGFDEESWCVYDLVSKRFAREIVDRDFRYNHGLPNYIASAPTLQMAMKWLREKHNIHIYVENYGTLGWIFILHRLNTGNKIRSNEFYNTYEEACEAAIKFYLENLI